jgi:hypothetical protein
VSNWSGALSAGISSAEDGDRIRAYSEAKRELALRANTAYGGWLAPAVRTALPTRLSVCAAAKTLTPLKT